MLTFQEKREYLISVLLRAKSLSTTEKMVAVAMAYKVDDHGVVDLRMDEIAALSSMTVRGLRDVLKRLHAKIDLDIRNGKAKNTYYFVQWKLL